MKYKYALFDLDGTLTDPYEGITNSVRHALYKLGRPIPGDEVLKSFIGPPLYDSFSKLGCDENEAARAIEMYREYFSTFGIYENCPYDGIKNLLSGLKSKGIHCLIATSKPEVFAKRILNHFNLQEYFEAVSGPELNQPHFEKKDSILKALAAVNVPAEEYINCIMIGDRNYDVIGAHECGICAVGVLWGYGSKEELKESGADYIAKDIKKLGKILL